MRQLEGNNFSELMDGAMGKQELTLQKSIFIVT